MKTVHRNKSEPAKLPGVWLGINERIEEVLIGTYKGVVKCRTVSRMSSDMQWDPKMVAKLQGVPWEVVPGKFGISVPVEIRDDGVIVNAEDDDQEVREQVDEE